MVRLPPGLDPGDLSFGLPPADQDTQFVIGTDPLGVTIEHPASETRIRAAEADPWQTTQQREVFGHAESVAVAYELLPPQDGKPGEAVLVVGPGAVVEIQKPVPPELKAYYGGLDVPESKLGGRSISSGFGGFNLTIIEMPRNAAVPPQGHPLDVRALLAAGGRYREPDKKVWVGMQSYQMEVMEEVMFWFTIASLVASVAAPLAAALRLTVLANRAASAASAVARLAVPAAEQAALLEFATELRAAVTLVGRGTAHEAALLDLWPALRLTGAPAEEATVLAGGRLAAESGEAAALGGAGRAGSQSGEAAALRPGVVPLPAEVTRPGVSNPLLKAAVQENLAQALRAGTTAPTDLMNSRRMTDAMWVLAENRTPENARVLKALPTAWDAAHDPNRIAAVGANVWERSQFIGDALRGAPRTRQLAAELGEMGINASPETLATLVLAEQRGARLVLVDPRQFAGPITPEQTAFFECTYAKSGLGFLDVPLTADQHGGAVHLIQDLVITEALQGQNMTAWEFRGLLGRLTGEVGGEHVGTVIWRDLYDPFIPGPIQLINQPEVLMPILRSRLPGLQ
jgi:hypothetical protein